MHPLLYSYYEDSRKHFGLSTKPIRNRPNLARKTEQGRNEKCNCGSGKKYKNCCGK